MQKIVLFSPAKLNLFLRILNRRTDGYHNLASLFQTIDFGDTLELSFSDVDCFSCSGLHLPMDGSNLVVKALNLFRQKSQITKPIRVHLIKRIPLQAGLGGGSSNAATMLWGLNMLFNSGIKTCELQKWSSEIGSDIPFFFSCGTAFCQGRGELVEDLRDLPICKKLFLVKPNEGLSTPRIFKELKLEECSSMDPKEILKSFYKSEPRFINDLEKPAFRLLPHLADLKEKLSENKQACMMTGSGTAFFTTGENHMKGEYFQTVVHPIRRKENLWYQVMPADCTLAIN